MIFIVLFFYLLRKGKLDHSNAWVTILAILAAFELAPEIIGLRYLFIVG